VSELTAVSLFAGIEGFGLALERCGVRVTAAVEIDPDCRGVIARHFPQTALFGDVKEVTGDQLRASGLVPSRGIVTAGWPCQGNSQAGRRKGMDDARSGLWSEVVRILADTRPRWFLGENVPGLLSVNDGLDFLTVVRDLDELGYGVAWRVLDAQHFGVPQRRPRVLIAGCLGDGAAPVEVLFDAEGGSGNPAARGEAGTDVAGCLGSRAGGSRTTDLDGHGAYVVGALATCGPGAGWRIGPDEAAAGHLVVSALQGGGRRGHRIDAEGAAGGQLIPFDTATNQPTVAYALTSRNDRNDRNDREDNWVVSGDPMVPMAFNPQTGGSKARIGYSEIPTAIGCTMATAVHTTKGVRRLTPLERERLQGFPDDWTRWTLRNGREVEQSDSARDRQTGNSVAVPVIEWVARRIVAASAALSATEAAA
jgi:DNA (cytosine-5)-methyltransferase 1